jgi:hypothetical protein
MEKGLMQKTKSEEKDEEAAKDS